MVIPKAGTEAHVREDRAALDLELTAQDLAALDRAFPPPRGRRPLEMLLVSSWRHAISLLRADARGL